MNVELDRTPSSHHADSCSSGPSKAPSLPLHCAVEQCRSIRPRTCWQASLCIFCAHLRVHFGTRIPVHTGMRRLRASPLLTTTNFVICKVVGMRYHTCFVRLMQKQTSLQFVTLESMSFASVPARSSVKSRLPVRMPFIAPCSL